MEQDSISISGRVFDLNEPKQILNTTIQLDYIKAKTLDGYYRFKAIPSNIEFQTIASSIGYLKIVSEP